MHVAQKWSRFLGARYA